MTTYNDIGLIVGLPGSGKTYNANKYYDIVVDDITSLDQLPSIEELLDKRMAITDVNFCDESILLKALEILKIKYPKKIITVTYFENNPEKCRRNVLYRSDGRNVEGTIRRFAPIYNPPSYALKIWQEMVDI